MELKDKLNMDNKAKKANPFCSKEVIDLLNYRIEQVEELDKLQTLLDKLETFGEDKLALKLLDQELA